MNSLSQAMLIARKDLAIEAATWRTLATSCALGGLIVVVLSLGFGLDGDAAVSPGSSAQRAAAVLWTAYLFAGVLCFERTMAVERRDEALDGLLMAPMGRGAIYWGKLLVNVLLLVGVGVVVVPAAVLLLKLRMGWVAAAPFAGIMLLALVGLSAIGTLFGAVVSAAGAKPGLLAAVVLPLSLPLILASTQLAGRIDGGVPVAGLGVLAAFDVIFLTAGWLVCEGILEP